VNIGFSGMALSHAHFFLSEKAQSKRKQGQESDDTESAQGMKVTSFEIFFQISRFIMGNLKVFDIII
jgi:hypothetical protein